MKIIKKNFYILFIIFFSFCTSGPDYEDFELSAEKWNTCMFWLEEYFIDDYLDHNTQKYLIENMRAIQSERSHHPSGSIAFLFKN